MCRRCCDLQWLRAKKNGNPVAPKTSSKRKMSSEAPSQCTVSAVAVFADGREQTLKEGMQFLEQNDKIKSVKDQTRCTCATFYRHAETDETVEPDDFKPFMTAFEDDEGNATRAELKRCNS